MGLGNRIKLLAEQKGLTILELSKITGISKNTLYAITKRDSDSIRYENLYKIATALNMTVDEIIGYDSSKPIEENLKNSPYYRDLKGIVRPLGNINFNRNKTLAAHFDGDEYTNEELEEIRKFAEFIKSKRKETE